MNTIIMPASNILISEAKSSRRYMTLSMRMFSTRENLNHVAVTEAFIDNIVAHKDEYVCMPLTADVKKMKAKDYRGLTHLYDAKKGTFLADVIGGFYDFEKVNDEYGVSLIGHARVNKRIAAVCEAIEDLYQRNALNFSFEISAGQLREENGVTVVDASEENELTAMAVVSVPAYPESKALDLVAEAKPTAEEYFANAKFIQAEMDVETVRWRFMDLLYEVAGDMAWNMRVLLFGVDFAILYDYAMGKSFKAEFIVDDDELVLKDCYPIEFTREEPEGSEEEMREDNMSNQQAEVIETNEAEEIKAEAEVQAEEAQTEEVKAEEVQAEEVKAEETQEEDANTEETEPEEEQVEAEQETTEVEESEKIAELQKQCADLEAQIEELKGYKAELEQLKAEREDAERKAKREELKAYAEAEGLDVENEIIASAIENMDHALLVSEVMKQKNAKKEEPAKISVVATFDMQQNGMGTSYLLGHSK